MDNRTKVKKLLSKYGIFFVFILLSVFASIISPLFLTSQNIINVLRQNVVVGLIACGEQIVLICGDTDLSSGSLVALSGCVAANIYLATDSIILSLLGAVAIGAVVGAANGFVVSHYNVPAFIMTLGMMYIVRGAVLAYTNATNIPNLGRLTILGKGNIGIVPVPVIILAIGLIIVGFILNKTIFGRHLYAVGGNRSAAEASGIQTGKVKILAFVLCGVFTAIAGVLYAARINAGYPASGEGYEFDAITAVIIGGTSFTGGIGSIGGTTIGIFIIGVINNVLNLLNVSSHYQKIVKGLIIVGAVIMDMKTKSKKGKN